jgi:hypothetical protein
VPWPELAGARGNGALVVRSQCGLAKNEEEVAGILTSYTSGSGSGEAASPQLMDVVDSLWWSACIEK